MPILDGDLAPNHEREGRVAVDRVRLAVADHDARKVELRGKVGLSLHRAARGAVLDALAPIPAVVEPNEPAHVVIGLVRVEHGRVGDDGGQAPLLVRDAERAKRTPDPERNLLLYGAELALVGRHEIGVRERIVQRDTCARGRVHARRGVGVCVEAVGIAHALAVEIAVVTHNNDICPSSLYARQSARRGALLPQTMIF